jgi:HPt (histidine-containing phosphotransfer) domain-containing protein
MDDYFSKSFSRKDLVTILGRWLSIELQSTPRPPLRVVSATPGAERMSPVIDRGVLERLRKAMGEEDFAELPSAYLGETRGMLDSLLEAHEKADTGELKRLAHNIKSSSAALGALHLSGLAKGLEAQVAEGEFDEVAQGIVVLRAEFAQVEVELDRLCGADRPVRTG